MKSEARKPAKILGVLILCLATASTGAQVAAPAAPHGSAAADSAAMSATDTSNLQQEVARLRDQVRQLEQRMQTSPSARMKQSGGMSMSGCQGDAGCKTQGAQPAMSMGMMDDDMPMGDPAMSGGASSGGNMGMMEMMRSRMSGHDMMGMGAMGGMKSNAAMATPSALPGFPGQSHLYHIGATGFFLDHPQHIALTTEQQQMLGQHKQQSLLKQGELQRQIDAAEEKLWQLTGADQPQIASIDKQVREIERLRADQRMAFIRAVGEAARVLTERQRQQLTGMAPASSAEPASMPMPNGNPPSSGKMDHM